MKADDFIQIKTIENHIAIGDEDSIPIPEQADKKSKCKNCGIEATESEMTEHGKEYYCHECLLLFIDSL